MNKRKPLWIVLLIGTIWLAGCATPVVVSNCPPLRVYDRAFNEQLAAEIEKSGPAVVTAVSDYYVLRRQVAACQGKP